jgi:peptidoglycan lytic transglycosylase
MLSIRCVNKLFLKIEVGHILLKAPLPLSANFRNLVRLFAVILTAATLAACAQSSVVTNKTALRAAIRQTPLAAVNAKGHFVTHRRVTGTQAASYGLASFYAEPQQTASGEIFDPKEMTAAHPTLPFGTRLRVTNVANGRSVTVRINDRGPFIAGRTVDVSYSAAEQIGIIDRGVAKVKLDVVR